MADEAINRAMEESYLFINDPVKRHEYLNRQIALLDYNSNIYGAKQEGMEEGMAKGMAKGRAEGVEEVAVNMLKNKFSLEQIQLCTSLSPEKIEQLAKENSLL